MREATRILCTGESELECRLKIAICDQLLLAHVSVDSNIPQYFCDKLDELIKLVTVKTWSDEVQGDRVGATIHGKHSKTFI